MNDPRDTCDHCGSTRLVWRKCKQICLDCGQINRSCADLFAALAAVLRGRGMRPELGACAHRS